MLERFFQLKANGTTPGREFTAALTTFAAMAYVLAVNASILSNAGLPADAVIVATGLAAAAGCFLMAALTNYPIGLAPGMGTNAYFAFVIVLGMGVPWQGALALVFWNGVLFLALSVSGLRRQVAEAIPVGLQVGIQAGIGFFIAFLGFQDAGLVVPNDATMIAHGNLTSPPALLAVGGLFLIVALTARKVPGAILIALAALTVTGLFLSGEDGPLTQIPGSVVEAPTGIGETFLALDWFYPFRELGALRVLFVLLILDLFDSLGTIIGLSRRAGLMDENDRLPKMDRALAADAGATILGALFGTSTTTSYIESASGIEAGGRTGLVPVIVGALFLLAIFLHPLIGAIPAVATAPVLIYVGLLMGQSLGDVRGKEVAEALTAVLTALAIPLFFSITHGIALGLLLYLAVRLATGRWREIRIGTALVGLLFVMFYALE
ncbi:MAG: NCS2 family permease [Opitutales bacterium]